MARVQGEQFLLYQHTVLFRHQDKKALFRSLEGSLDHVQKSALGFFTAGRTEIKGIRHAKPPQFDCDCCSCINCS